MNPPPTKPFAPPADLRTETQFLRFLIVGGTGFVVNLVAFQMLLWVVGGPQDVFWHPPGIGASVRNYHVFAMAAFVVANTSNYILNRYWTFKSAGITPWRTEYGPFLIVGAIAQAAGLLLLTAFLHPSSPVRIDSELVAQAVTIVLVTPVNFAGNKLWTFRAAQRHRRVPRT